MNCNICESPTLFIFEKNVLSKYKVGYFRCKNCGFVQTEKPFWLNEAYQSPINKSDTGILKRNIYLSGLVEETLYKSNSIDGRFLDYAGGYGIFVRLMRDKGFDFYRHDPYCSNLFAEGFDLPHLSSLDQFQAITAFEVFEHVESPRLVLEKWIGLSPLIIMSTELYDSVDKLANWEYLAPHHGQHISFYSLNTLVYLAKSYGWYLYSNGSSVHIFSKTKLNFDPFTQKTLVSRLLDRFRHSKRKESLTHRDSLLSI